MPTTVAQGPAAAMPDAPRILLIDSYDSFTYKQVFLTILLDESDLFTV